MGLPESQNVKFIIYPRVSPGAAPLTKKPEDSGYEIGIDLKTKWRNMHTESGAWICFVDECEFKVVVFGQRRLEKNRSGMICFRPAVRKLCKNITIQLAGEN